MIIDKKLHKFSKLKQVIRLEYEVSNFKHVIVFLFYSSVIHEVSNALFLFLLKIIFLQVKKAYFLLPKDYILYYVYIVSIIGL